MTLQEWATLDADKRRELEAHWRHDLKQPWRIGEIADCAARVLADELKDLSSVTAVSVGVDRAAQQCVMLVTTCLRANEKVEGVPEEFVGFPVKQIGVAERKRDYLRRLEVVLRTASVPEVDVCACLKQFEEELGNATSPY